MGKIKGFMEYDRREETTAPVQERVEHYREFTRQLPAPILQEQGARCMECGIPFCHSGCPLGNLIPDFNDAVYKNQWQKALELLHRTNNFPEFTGRLCPAPCESACVLGLIQSPVAIELIEKNIVERGFAEGWITAHPPAQRTGKKVAVVGSGPAGLAAAQQLNRAGHEVTVFERDAELGGLLRFGIPDFKLEKRIIDRRIALMEAEGIRFETGCHIGHNLSIETLNTFDAVVLCTGSTVPRKLPVPGHEAHGVIQAMEFLKHSNEHVAGLHPLDDRLNASGKNIIVIGGGDTGSDCVGTANRQKAASVTNFEIMPQPSDERTFDNPWPFWPFTLKTTTSHEEGCDRNWSLRTEAFQTNAAGEVTGVQTTTLRWNKNEQGRWVPEDIPHSTKVWPCDMAILALGFTGTEKSLPEQLGLEVLPDGTLKTSKHQTTKPHIFAAGDARRGQSLVVWAISEGREAAFEADRYLMGSSALARKNHAGDLPKA